MSIKNDREYRTLMLPEMQFRAADQEGEEPQYIVEGYATTYDDPYTIFSFDGVDYKETISRDALAGADMSDVIFLYNHEGMVYARQSNGTLQLSSDERGLHVRADLGSTEASREMFESIKAGLVTQMSWAFTINTDEYDEETHTRSITSVKKVYDVSAVSIPANPSTDIAARSYWDGVISEEQEKRRRDLERAEKLERIKNLLRGDK
jgi:HK97 family phage prohead protease